MQATLTSKLDKFATVIMIVASLVLIWVAVAVQRRLPPQATTPVYRVGDRVDSLPGVDFAAAPRTLILFVRSGCKYCTASAAFYRRLVSRSGRIPIIAVSFESQDRLSAYLDEQGVRPDKTISATGGSLKLRSTPTLVLVSRTAIVEKVWIGQLTSSAQEDEVLRAIDSTRTD